jgi:glycosyltransferase 2 family protein
MRTRLPLVVGVTAGVAALVFLLARHDVPAIGRLFSTVGWGLLLIVGLRAAALAFAGAGWARLVQPLVGGELGVLVVLRWIRESINCLLPVAQVGGDLMGGRLLTFFGVSGSFALASILVDLLVQLGTQVCFALVGLSVLVLTGTAREFAGSVAACLAIAVAALTGFYLVQRPGAVGAIESRLMRATQNSPFASRVSNLRLHESLARLHRRPDLLLLSGVLHFAAWLPGIGEVWVALAGMGVRPGLAEAVVLESLGQALRSFGFSIPGALGVQEAGFLVLGQVYGLSPEVSLALSLVKRVPDLALGIPGLFAWHLLETRRVLARGQSA